jgi:hypothetical protein
MPKLSTPRSLPLPIVKGLPSSPGGDAGVGRPADDLQRAVLAVRAGVDRAHTQAVGVGVLVGGQDLGHHDAAERRRDGAQFLHLHAGHGQQVGQGLGVQCWVAELAQPRFRELHVFGPLRG